MRKLKCQKCEKEWMYTGERLYYATCPDCKSSVKIKGGDNESSNLR